MLLCVKLYKRELNIKMVNPYSMKIIINTFVYTTDICYIMVSGHGLASPMQNFNFLRFCVVVCVL